MSNILKCEDDSPYSIFRDEFNEGKCLIKIKDELHFVNHFPREWINVGIAYPECHVNVLLSDGYKIGFGYREENDRYTHWKSHSDLGWITHWMALPELPK